MENNQLQGNQSSQWIETWSRFMLQSSSVPAETQEQAMALIGQLLQGQQQGDSCLSITPVMRAYLGALLVSEEQLTTQITPFVHDAQRLYLYRYWMLEQSLAQHVARLKQQQVSPIDLSAYSDLLQDEHQKQALAMAAQQALNIITGGPGTGKTYTLARIIAVLHQSMPNIRIAMAAPTGKAAQRMKEALQNSLSDKSLSTLVTPDLQQLQPVTLHRLLGLGNTAQPRFHAQQPLPYDVIVVDEASMLDLNLANMLFAAVPDQARLILLGDADQLASVDVGSVLADLQAISELQGNHSQLLTSRRFQQGALIGQMARFIQGGKPADITTAELLQQFEQQVVAAGELQSITCTANMADVIQLEYLPAASAQALSSEAYEQKLMAGYQDYLQSLQTYLQSEDPNILIAEVIQAFDHYRILTAIHHGTLGLKRLNELAERWLLNQLSPWQVKIGDWYVGRPVMMSYNDYQLGLSNGDIGICFKHRSQPDQFEVYFPSLEKWVMATRLPKSVQTAFALTIHKSQGSEFTHTAVVLDQAAQNLLSQELIYTAITRAKKVVSLLVDREAFAQSLRIRSIRQSGLVDKVKKNLCL